MNYCLYPEEIYLKLKVTSSIILRQSMIVNKPGIFKILITKLNTYSLNFVDKLHFFDF